MDTDRLRELLEVRIPVAAIARQNGLTRQQIYRQIHRDNVMYQRHDDISEEELTAAILAIKENHPESGEVMVTGHLRQRGIFVQRDRVRNIIRDVDPEGIERRRRHTIRRRVYNVPCPHYVWHLDGNHKLIKWKFVIHGSIDGFTRLITFLKVNDNNRAGTVSSQFQHAVNEFEWPVKIRTDHGGENQDVWRMMEEKNGPHSVIVGSSVHNERIERLWRDVNEKVSSKYKTLFQEMTDLGTINPDNEVDLTCLHWVYKRLIQRDLSEFAGAHNMHGISTEGGMSPIQLYIAKRHLTEIYVDEPRAVGEPQAEFEDEEIPIHPIDLNLPLPHVHCNIDRQFCPELREELRLIGRPDSFQGAEAIFQRVVYRVGRFIERNGHL